MQENDSLVTQKQLWSLFLVTGDHARQRLFII